MQKPIFYTLLALLATAFSFPSAATSWYVSNTGTAAGNGSFTGPWSLSFALARPTSVVKAGDTIWLRGGIYTGTFISTLRGSIDQPVVVCNYPNERPVIRGNPQIGQSEITLEINGYSSCFIGIEITGAAGNRMSAGSANPPPDIYTCSGIEVHGEYTKIINCIIHDCPGIGVGYWSDALNAEIYGCLIYNNGYSNASRGHGPGIYVQNADILRSKAIRNNFIFNGFSVGIQFYAFANVLKGLILDSNTVFNSGSLTTATQTRRANLIAGGENAGAGARVRNFKARDNVFYRDTTDNTAPQFMPHYDYRKNVELGNQDEGLYDVDIDFSRNHVFGDPVPILLHKWDSGIFKNNTLYAYKNNYPGNRRLIEQEYGAAPFANWDSNYYYTNEIGFPNPFGDRTFADWKQTYGVDAHSVFTNTSPTANSILIRKNRFEPHKYYVTVMNYENRDTVLLPYDVTLNGSSYAVFDIQNSWRIPVDSGIYNESSIRLNMNTRKVAAAVGIVPSPPKHTGKSMGTYIVEFYPEIYTVKNGTWNDPTVWNTGKIPACFNRVSIYHQLTVGQNAWCKSVKVLNGLVTVASGVLINVGPQ